MTLYRRTPGGAPRPLVKPHFDLYKALTRGRFGAVTPQEAFANAPNVKRDFTVEDVEQRACRMFGLAVAQGVGRIRAQCDADFATRLVSFEGLLRARERFAHLIDLQIVAFHRKASRPRPPGAGSAPRRLARRRRLPLGVPEFERSVDDQRTHLHENFQIAEEFDVSVDVHADYLDTPELKTLEMLAELTIERGFQVAWSRDIVVRSRYTQTTKPLA